MQITIPQLVNPIPALTNVALMENRIIGHYNDAFVNNPTISKKDARSLAVNKTAEEAYRYFLPEQH